MERMFNLSNLIKFLHETLVFTEEMKNLLKLNCDEAMFCLKPWCIEVVSQQEISKDACICPKKSESEIEEIAAGINRALLQTQQLREKLSMNVVAEKKSVFRMYHCSQENEQRKVRNFRAGGTSTKQNLYSSKGSNQKVTLDKRLHNELAKRNVDEKGKETGNDNKRSVANPVKLTEKKNFLAINKRSINRMTDIRKQKETNYELENNPKPSSSITKTNCIKFTERRSAASTSELKGLIQKVSNKSSSSTISSEHIIQCPLYVDISSPPIYKQSSISMNIIDGLNMTNIPGEIIKSLKIYHTYLDIEHSKKSSNDRQEKTFHKFLAEFNTMDKVIQEKLATRNYDMVLLPKFMGLFRPLFSIHLDCTNLMNIKAKYAELNPPCKVYEMEFNSGQIYKSDTTKWILNGIWNSEYSGSLKGMSKACCLRYTKNDELLSFFNTMQELRGAQYYRNLLKIITEDVLPYMENTLDSTQLEYAKMYKMIFILSQGLQSKVPVLVRTDK